jgi:cephalosporin-C deacetylase
MNSTHSTAHFRAFRKTFTCIAIFYLCWLTTAARGQDRVSLTPRNPTGVYRISETVAWSVKRGASSADSANANGKHTFVVRKNNQDVIKQGEIDLSAPDATIEASLDEPGMLYLEVEPPGGGQRSGGAVAGAAVGPTELKPVAPRPDDFDAFWEGKVNLLKQVPEKPVLTSKDGGNPAVEYATIRMDHVNGTHVHGQIAKPRQPGKRPALAIFQWASPPYPLQKDWVVPYAAKGWLTLNIEPHDVLPDEPQAYYDALPQSLKNYNTIGMDDRDKSYFVEMYLRGYRAVDYLASHPDWDGKTLVVMGTSMGGQQSLCVAGLHPKVTHVIVNEPAGCDTNGPLHGRQIGYPFFPPDDAKVMAASRYVDPIHFAPRIKATSLVSMGFVDTTTPPAGIWTAFNLIPGPKEAVPLVDSPHNHQATPAQQRPIVERTKQWLNTLVKGGDVTPRAGNDDQHAPAAPLPSRADRPEPRTDAKSQLAHQQLVEKARKGGIDVYFVGDSITRRWGCSDPQYADLLANWKRNFHGWNAGNFGWGADRVQNILWRLHNGELDGVNPKVIVVLAGTNDLSARHDDAGVADVTSGLRAVLDVCRAKAPDATIILTGILPRAGDASLRAAIGKVNRNLAAMADGKRVRYLNVNDRLADSDGTPLEGMTGDGLHLTVKGYQVWADGLKPILTELLGSPATTDYAPPPTGDPSATR